MDRVVRQGHRLLRRSGRQHAFVRSEIGLFGTNGIVCGGNPSAVGAAISATVRQSGQVAVAFFGDGGSNSGSFHESMNFAGVQHAPVVFVCENNLYATATPPDRRDPSTLTFPARPRHTASLGSRSTAMTWWPSGRS